MATATANTFVFKLPDIGEGVVEGEIVKWLVKEGDEVVEDQPLVEVMTDKATVEISSPKRGRVSRTHGQEGEIAKVHHPLVEILLDGEAAPEAAAIAPVQPELPPVAPAAREVIPEAPGKRVLATPATRKLARELGIDIRQVPGSGPMGRVTKEDLRAFSGGAQARPALAPQVPQPVGALEERIPLRGLRKKIAEKMSQSKQTAAHFTYVDEVDMTELIALRKQAKPLAEKQGVKLTFLPFIFKAVCAALKKFPQLNATVDDKNQELVLKKVYNLGLAVATDAGLIVPVVKDVDRKSIYQIAQEIEGLAERARLGKNSLDELQGGTFTLSSIGSIGGLFATPIINYPEVGIMAINKIHSRPVVRDGQIVARDMMYLALSFDHRVVDGSVGAEFTNQVISYLQNPSLMFMEMV